MTDEPNPPPPTLFRIDTGPAAIVILAGIICACGICAALVLAGAHGLNRLAQLETRINTLDKFEACEAPQRTGDTSVITIRHDGQHLLTRCQRITDWRSPERIKP